MTTTTMPMTSHFMRHPSGFAFLAFNVNHCEACNCECEVPNAFNVSQVTASQLRGLGATLVKGRKRLPSLDWCDALGMAVCPKCYKTET